MAAQIASTVKNEQCLDFIDNLVISSISTVTGIKPKDKFSQP
jgi:hypothetical protein